MNLPSTVTTEAQSPLDLVEVGYVMGAYGIQGWVRIKPYSTDADALLTVSTWWLEKQELLRSIKVIQARPHSDEIIAQLSGVKEREMAEALRGSAVQISRGQFPALGKDEFYWVDLIGLSVVNMHGVSLGIIRDLMDNGAHQVLVVRVDSQIETEKQRELLIPFVDQFVLDVSLEHKKVTVDWELDY